MIKANAEGRATATYFTETQKIVGYMIFLSIILFEHTLCPLFAPQGDQHEMDHIRIGNGNRYFNGNMLRLDGHGTRCR